MKPADKPWFDDEREVNLYARVPEDIIYDKSKEAPIHLARVYGVLDRHLNKRTGLCFPGHRKISELTGISRSQIQKSLDYLEEKGLIRVLREDGKSNRYALVPVGNLRVGEVALQQGHPPPAPTDVQGGPTEKPGVAPPSVHNQSLLTKAKTKTPQGVFVDWFKDEYQKAHGKPYLETKADFIKAADLLKLFKLETLQRMVHESWKEKEWIRTAARTVKGFSSIINHLKMPTPTAPAGELTDEQILSAREEDLRHKDKIRRWKLDAQKKDRAS